MGLLSFFKRDAAAPAAKRVADTADAVQQLRLQARHRLIGAAVLVGLGVIGFPLLFETQPRPIPVDLPIDIPNKDGVPPLQIPAQRTTPDLPALPPVDAVEARAEGSARAASGAVQLNQPAAAKLSERTPERSPEKAPEKSPERAPGRAPEMAPERVPDRSAQRVAEKTVDKAESKRPAPAAAASRSTSPTSNPESARVQALLEGKPAASKPGSASRPADGNSSASRLIIQVGAYADSKAAQEARMKVERLGLKTYTQVVETPAGRRTRVRLGPFASREEADRAAARVRAAGLSTAVLSL